MTEPAGIGENICHPESTIPIEWLLERNITVTRSVIDSPDPAVWAVAQGVIVARWDREIRTHLVWNSEGAGTGAWPAPHSNAERIYLDRFKTFCDGVPYGAIMSATAGNEGSTPGWTDTEGQPITTATMARTADVFAPVCAKFGVEPWATSIHTNPADAIALAQAIRGLCHGVPYHPYFRSIGTAPIPGWRYGTVEDVADQFAEGYPDDVACCFDELGCPTIYDHVGEAGQASYCANLIAFQHPKIERCWYFTGPREAIPQAELDDGKDWWIVGRAAAEAVFRNPGGGTMPDPYDPWQGAIGPGLITMMRQDSTLPAQRSSTWLPLGVHPSDVEEAYGQNGILYTWLLSIGKGFRFPPDR